MSDRSQTRRRASVEVLRAEADDERSVLIIERLRAGEDPWEFMEELPSIDQLVVFMLRAEYIAEDGGALPSRTRHHRVLRQIALDYPELTKTVWQMLGKPQPHRRWDAVVAGEQA